MLPRFLSCEEVGIAGPVAVVFKRDPYDYWVLKILLLFSVLLMPKSFLYGFQKIVYSFYLTFYINSQQILSEQHHLSSAQSIKL